MQFDYVQICHMNKVEKFWKDMQTIFFKGRYLSYIQDRDYVSKTWYKIKRCKKSKSYTWGTVCW